MGLAAIYAFRGDKVSGAGPQSITNAPPPHVQKGSWQGWRGMEGTREVGGVEIFGTVIPTISQAMALEGRKILMYPFCF